MDIKTKFSPITITLENEEELSFILEVLDMAKKQYMSSRFMDFSRKYSDPFPSRCEHMERRLYK